MRRFVLDLRLASAASAIALLVVALLASAAGAAVPRAHALDVTAAPSASSSAPRLDRGREVPPEREGAARPSFVRATAPAITRLLAPSTTGGDGTRGGVVVGVPTAWVELLVPRQPGGAVEARAHGISAPGQPAPSSRAPPLG